MNQIQPPQIVSYRPIKDGGYYIIKVSALFGDNDCYRVSLKEEYDDHTTQIADINLRRPRAETYLIESISQASTSAHAIVLGTTTTLLTSSLNNTRTSPVWTISKISIFKKSSFKYLDHHKTEPHPRTIR